jgi:hypothetical protein
MWNLSGDDIAKAKAELNGRRAAIQAKYDGEIKKLESDLAALETFERAAMKFVSDFKDDGAAAAETAADAAPDGAAEPGEKGSSRWRMHLGARDAATEA